MKVYTGRCCAKRHTGWTLSVQPVAACQSFCLCVVLVATIGHWVTLSATFEAAVSNISFVDKAAATMSLHVITSTQWLVEVEIVLETRDYIETT